jgi:histidinol phosphatase-like enzyme (inositol monophosphatase family)
VTESQDTLLHAVQEAAQLAGKVALPYYRTSLAVETKGDGSPVTIADRNAERAVRDWIVARFPNDAILGEEFGEQPGTSGRRWVLDPIDGTKSFIRGVPLWGSLVSVVDGGQVLAGAACFAAVGETIAAARGCGTWHNGSRTAVSTIADLALATVLITDDRTVSGPLDESRWKNLVAEAGVYRTWGDCFGYLLVATGRAEVMVDPIANPWDVACFQPIIEEAGGVFTDLRGTSTAFGGNTIATNNAMSGYVRQRLGIG